MIYLDNVAAHSEYFGFSLEFGNNFPLGEMSNNTAHGNEQEGFFYNFYNILRNHIFVIRKKSFNFI